MSVEQKKSFTIKEKLSNGFERVSRKDGLKKADKIFELLPTSDALPFTDHELNILGLLLAQNFLKKDDFIHEMNSTLKNPDTEILAKMPGCSSVIFLLSLITRFTVSHTEGALKYLENEIQTETEGTPLPYQMNKLRRLAHQLSSAYEMHKKEPPTELSERLKKIAMKYFEKD